MKFNGKRPGTAAVHAGDRVKPADYVPVTTPIYAASTFFYDNMEELDRVLGHERDGMVYTRFGNPTTAAFEAQMAALENADAAFATASGMAAMHLAVEAALIDRKRTVLAADVMFGQTATLLTKVLEQHGVETRFADPCDLPAFEAAIHDWRPSCVLVEAVSNPLIRVPALDRVIEAARAARAHTVVDSTFPTPILLRPLDLGADFVVHSATKYLAGHGDCTGGVLLSRQEFRPTIELLNKIYGPTLGPFEAYLAMRGVKTLALRLTKQCENARVVAAWLKRQAGVERVYFPGDPEHPDHGVARRLFREGMFGAMMSFDVEGGREAALRFMNSLRLVVPATSLGDVHTMVSHPAMASHRELPPARRRRLGIGDGLVRMSVGIEDVEDILEDLEQAFAAVRRTTAPAAD